MRVNGKQPSENEIARLKRRSRILLLLDALERAGVTPIPSRKLHGFAYLADVLSPVWNLLPYDGKILKIEDGPHYPDLQFELDLLVFLGLVDVQNIQYSGRPGGGARIEGDYSLRFESEHLSVILKRLGAADPEEALDPLDTELHQYLFDLAGALAMLPDDEIDLAATKDATYANKHIAPGNIIDFGAWVESKSEANRSLALIDRFRNFIPPKSNFSPGERIYLYASYLGEQVRG